MRNLRIAALAMMMSVTALWSCTEVSEMDSATIENRSLKAWMRNHHPELVENYQEEGAYYVEVLDAGNPDSLSTPLNIDIDADDETSGSWVFFTITGRDLEGRVCLTRDEQTARMQGTFTKFTHYVPYMRFLGNTNSAILEGSYLAMKNTIKLGEKYAADNGLQSSFTMCSGTRLRLYLPSSLTGGAGLVGDGGYEGEFSLDDSRPVIVDIEVTGRINNPVSYEAYMVDGFGLAHGDIAPLKDAEDVESSDDSEEDDEEDDDTETPEDEWNWRYACDTIQGLIVSKRYKYSPADVQFDYDFEFNLDTDEDSGYEGKSVRNAAYSDSGVYSDIATLEAQINEALVERFGEGVYDGAKVGTDGSANIWYITRFLDGFIVDSNIAEVRELVYGADEASGEVLTYSPESDKDSYVTAWYYTVPGLRYGQWATIVTTSTFAYGASGRSGSTTTSSSGASYYYNPYYSYYNYYNSYYGSSYYDMYYYNMYNNYYNNYYYNSSSTTETTTSTSTEVQPYTPLIFQIYIEAEDE